MLHCVCQGGVGLFSPCAPGPRLGAAALWPAERGWVARAPRRVGTGDRAATAQLRAGVAFVRGVRPGRGREAMQPARQHEEK